MRAAQVFLAVLAAAAVPGSVTAAPTRPFVGAYVGPALGGVEHHVGIVVTDNETGETVERTYRAWAVGGGAFAGYDLPVARQLRLGAEAELSLGGASERFVFLRQVYVQRPRYGYRLAGRVGYAVGDRVLAYGALGYGEHRYRIVDTAGIEGAGEWRGGLVAGAGVEYRASPGIGVRLDYKHLAGAASHVLIGVPIRF